MVAAALKGYRFGTDPFARDPILPSRLLSVGAVLIEFGIAVWLILGIWPARARVVAILLFSLFLCLSLRSTLLDARSCGCFGAIDVRPWLSTVLNLVLIVLLCWLGSPPAPFAQETRALVMLVVLTVGAAAGVWLMMPDPQFARLAITPEQIDVGTLRQGQKSEVRAIIYNNYSRDFIVADIKSTCPCLSLYLANDLVAANGTVECKICIDLAHEPEFTGYLSTEIQAFDVSRNLILRFSVLIHVIGR